MIEIRSAGSSLVRYEESIFPGGEVHIRLKNGVERHVGPFTITAYLHSSNDLMKLLLITDALKIKYGNAPIHLVLPYVPYGRQDRVCNPGESLSLRVFANIINSQDYQSVEIWDPHSDVTYALINRVNVVHQCAFVLKTVNRLLTSLSSQQHKLLLCAPDQGALKKAQISSKLVGLPLINAEKIRDPKTTQITDIKLNVDSSYTPECDILIIDDICDGGRTFIELAKKLKQKFDGNIYLYVTHGIFSKDLDVVLEAGIKHIYTANLWPDRGYVPYGKKVTEVLTHITRN